MAVYPDSIVTKEQLPNDRLPSTPLSGNHAQDHNTLAEEVRAIELELGIRPRGTSPTLAARLAAMESNIPTASNFVSNGQKGAAGGVATLGSDKKVPSSQLTTATVGVAGIVRLATSQEALDGLNNSTAITPARLKAVLDALTLDSALAELIDVDGAVVGQVLKWDGAKFSPGTDLNDGSGVSAVADLDDVDITAIEVGQTVIWDGTQLVPSDLPSPGAGSVLDQVQSLRVSVDATAGLITIDATDNDHAVYVVELDQDLEIEVSDAGTVNRQIVVYLVGDGTPHTVSFDRIRYGGHAPVTLQDGVLPVAIDCNLSFDAPLVHVDDVIQPITIPTPGLSVSSDASSITATITPDKPWLSAEASIDGGPYQEATAGVVVFEGLTGGESYTILARAKDQYGNVSEPASANASVGEATTSGAGLVVVGNTATKTAEDLLAESTLNGMGLSATVIAASNFDGNASAYDVVVVSNSVDPDDITVARYYNCGAPVFLLDGYAAGMDGAFLQLITVQARRATGIRPVTPADSLWSGVPTDGQGDVQLVTENRWFYSIDQDELPVGGQALGYAQDGNVLVDGERNVNFYYIPSGATTPGGSPANDFLVLGGHYLMTDYMVSETMGAFLTGAINWLLNA